MSERVDATPSAFDAEGLEAAEARIRELWLEHPLRPGGPDRAGDDIRLVLGALEAAEHWRDVWKTTCDAHLVVLGDMQAELRKHVPADHDLLHPDAVELAVGLREEMRQALEAAEERNDALILKGAHDARGWRERIAELTRERDEARAQVAALRDELGRVARLIHEHDRHEGSVMTCDRTMCEQVAGVIMDTEGFATAFVEKIRAEAQEEVRRELAQADEASPLTILGGEKPQKICPHCLGKISLDEFAEMIRAIERHAARKAKS